MDTEFDNTSLQYREHQRSIASSLGFKRLLPINTDTFPEEEFLALWDKVKLAEYAFEDTTRGDRAEFARRMLLPGTYNFEIPGELFAQLVGASKGSNASLHFITLSQGPMAPVMDAAAELFAFAFNQLEIHRLTAFVPSFNQKVIRMATLARMKFEGQMRKSFLYENQWWDLHFYGLLETEWRRRG